MANLAPPPCPFGSWDQLRLKDVRAFLRGNPAERTIWEAKQNASKGELAGFVRKESCAFANRRGGYLLLGAVDEEDGWTLRGVGVPGVTELHDWIASLLQALEPQPGFDVHEWGLSNGRKVAIVQIDPAPIPPVSFDGRVYIRHGSQTLTADGRAISRLSNEGARAIRVVERATRKRAKDQASQLFAPMAIAIGRPGQRDRPLTDPEPEQVAYGRLREALLARWPKLGLSPLIMGPDREVKADAADVLNVMLHPGPDPAYTGWRAAWEMEDVVQTQRWREWIDRAHKRPCRWGSGPDPGSRDIWTVHIEPDAVAVCSHLPVPGGGRQNWLSVYGKQSISHAETLLRAMVRMEHDLGADPSEQLFICLGLRNPWTNTRDVVIVESWASLSVNPREWRKEATAQAAQRMNLTPPERVPVPDRVTERDLPRVRPIGRTG
jgi:hypothetical protein